MRFVSLRFKFAVLFIAVTVVLLVLNIAWRSYVQQEQAEREMLEATQVLATEMDAVWDFMEINQTQFKRHEDGTYNLYCVVAAKAVARIFTTQSDGFIIHYTNLTTRKPDDAPDDFEKKALERLMADPELTEYYELTTDFDGMPVFRYVEPLYISESCLECHGEPAGELDIMGYPKEGQHLGDIAGAVSIIMPAETYMQSLRTNVWQETLVFSIFIIGGLGAIFWGISRLVTSPVRRLESAAKQIEQHEFEIDLDDIGYRDEVRDLASSFTEMARQLKELYEELGSEVEVRTAQIQQSNLILEEQRRELELMNLRLQEDNQLKSEFLAMVSHEIRTPLTSILAFADIWESTNAPRNENEEKIMREMRANSQILLSMINNILEMARIEAGKSEVMMDAIEVTDVVNLVTRNLSFLADKKHLAVKAKVERDVPIMLSDSEKLRHILVNLVSNAIKFTQDEGVVALNVSYDFGTEQVVFVVSDNGCGIAPDDIPFIFDRFARGLGYSRSGGSGGGAGSGGGSGGGRRGHAGSSSLSYSGSGGAGSDSGLGHSGSGLGLALVKEYVELLGGTITLESVLGEGSKFTVRVPAKAVDEEMAIQEAGLSWRDEHQEEGDADEDSSS